MFSILFGSWVSSAGVIYRRMEGDDYGELVRFLEMATEYLFRSTIPESNEEIRAKLQQRT
jgi:hypothetical protein